VISALEPAGLIKGTGMDHTLDISPKQLQQQLIKARIPLPSSSATTAATDASNAHNGDAQNGRSDNGHSSPASSKADHAAAAAAASGAVSSSCGTTVAATAAAAAAAVPHVLEFKAELLHWRPPAGTVSLSSPSVSFPDNHSPQRKSHSKKRIRY
jgi:hypothetical protein